MAVAVNDDIANQDLCPRCGILRIHAKHPDSCGPYYQHTGCFLGEKARAARLAAAEAVAEAAHQFEREYQRQLGAVLSAGDHLILGQLQANLLMALNEHDAAKEAGS